MKRFLLVVLSLCLAAVASADMTIVQKITSGPMMGQPGKDATMTIYLKGNKERMDYDKEPISMIVDLEKNQMFMIDHSKKQVMTTSLDEIKKMGGMMTGMAGNMKTNVVKTGKSDTVNGFKCDEYTFNTTGQGMMNMSGSVCVSSSIDASEFEPFKEYGQEMMKMLGSEELSNLKGMPVRSISKVSIMGQTVDTSSEVLSISRDSVSDSRFVLPTDYKVEEMKIPQMPKQ